MKNIALVGAGGKMGCRITDNLKDSRYEMAYLENGPEGIERLASRGLRPTEPKLALPAADAVILAIPDVAIGQVSQNIVPQMKSGAMLMLLDPAAAYLGQLPQREDLVYFVTHPCHPPLFNEEIGDARKDYFGGVKAKQAIVCALMQGDEAKYAAGEQIAKAMFAPVMRSHRLTVEQMAMLEPTMAETLGSTFAVLYREALDEAVRCGVPAEAARDFMLGHINIQLAIVFGEAGNPFSDACKVAIEYGKRHVIKEGWRDLFKPEKVYEQIDVMLHPEKLGSIGKEPEASRR
jgi:hypothetical protein